MREQMKGRAVSLGDVVTRIEIERAALAVRSRDLAKMLKEAVSNQSNPDKLQRILGRLRSRNETGSSPTAQGFQEVYAGREITLASGSRAIEMHVPVNGEIIRAVLSAASFFKTRSDQDAYAQGLGGRLATQEENRAVLNDLLEKEENRTLNDAEQKLLRAYREGYVRDSKGGLADYDGRVSVRNDLHDASSSGGALVVLPLAESK